MNSREDIVRITPDVLASREKRFLTFLIDYLVRFVIVFFVAVLLGMMAYLTGDNGYLIWLDNLTRVEEILYEVVIVFIYYMILESITARTIGKYITGTKVLLKDGSKPEAYKILLRTLCRFIPFDPLSFFGTDSRGWHDTLTETFVVDVKKYNELKRSQLSLSEIGKESSNY